jgi:type I restriction-modification system DNA methylase subunit
MNVLDELAKLISHFENNLNQINSQQYNETQVRREFIDPFFRLLGWDIENKNGYAEAYKDVIHEDSIKIGGFTKAPDYCFRIGGTRKFFVEAKKPGVNIKDDPIPAYQLRRYAWSSKLPLSILTDFEEFSVYDCRTKPSQKDSPTRGRIKYITYKKYLDEWDYLCSTFSREAVLKGSFDRYVENNKLRKGTAEVDEAFLEEIENWRDILARNIALRNESLSNRELNYAVQATIDRIIFLRICGDRGIEPYEKLMSLQNGTGIYSRLVSYFKEADQKYNSGLFHFEKEEGRESPDELTPRLEIDDEVLKRIIKNLYYPESPYEFSVIPAEILGQVYEQFLGKVIRLTPAHQAKVEYKPEVKKAGGVYYTPSYIVDYIVKNTVGKMLEDKTPATVGGDTHPRKFNDAHLHQPLRILDPACGSGSFLLGAYEYLLRWYCDRYIEEGPEKFAKSREPALYQSKGGEWKLTTSERKRILLNHIYGVDIDSQAVEVTKLSLLLKVLEGESQESINNQLKLYKERVLPDLSNNIKCGNSLIGSDFYEGRQLNLFNDEEKYRINAFDWEEEFPEVFKDRIEKKDAKPQNYGFDVVIGNPPYGMRLIYSEEEKKYFKEHYQSSEGSYENYFLFYEASLRFLKEKGKHGFIVPVTWLTIPSARSLRSYILNHFSIDRIVWLPKLIFKKAKVNNMISIISNDGRKNVEVYIYNSEDLSAKSYIYKKLNQKDFLNNNFEIGIFINEGEKEILGKIDKVSIPLKDVACPCSGYNPYEIGKGIAPDGKPHTKETVETKPYHSDYKLDDSWKPEINGRDLKRYYLELTGARWVKYGLWLAAPRKIDNFQGERILVQEITGGEEKRIVAAYYDKELYHSRDIIPIKCSSKSYHPYYLLGVLNSYLISWLHHKRNPKSQKALFPKILVSDLKKIPIAQINKSNMQLVEKLIENVNSIIELNKSLEKAKISNAIDVIQRQITATDKQIDRLVYDLYGLTEDEIKIVEEER